MISAEQILNPIKPEAASKLNPAILSLEVLIDEQPVLRGAADEAMGTDLSGTVCLALAAAIDATQINVQLAGASTLNNSGPNSGSSNANSNALVVFESSRNIWTSNPSTPRLLAGAHDLRFLFKIPGTLPATEAGRVQYVLSVSVTGPQGIVLASLVEAVRIVRIIPGAGGDGEGLPAYGNEGEGMDGPPVAYDDSVADSAAPTPGGDLPPSYDFKGKTRA
ncbi:hypothetical protein HDU81_003964 [Chytriomyces hyalinus]|nr:hypothetical protein HDU81_003964 [Chytriomyces hyalinus]